MNANFSGEIALKQSILTYFHIFKKKYISTNSERGYRHESKAQSSNDKKINFYTHIAATEKTTQSHSRLFSDASPPATLSLFSSCIPSHMSLRVFWSLAWRVAKGCILYSKNILEYWDGVDGIRRDFVVFRSVDHRQSHHQPLVHLHCRHALGRRYTTVRTVLYCNFDTSDGDGTVLRSSTAGRLLLALLRSCL